MAKNKFPVSAKDIPVTQAMLYGVRDELVKRMDAGFKRHDAKFISLEARFKEIDARFVGIDARFVGIDARFQKIDARFDKIDARFTEQDAKFDKLGGEIHRLAVLVEEQNAKNNIVLEGLRGLFDRQERVEKRTDQMEQILSRLAQVAKN